MHKSVEGFTLIELMIVVAIIGILAAIAIPQYQDYVARSQVSEALSLGSGLKSAVGEVGALDGNFANANSGTIRIPIATAVSGKYVETGSVANGVITFTFRPTGSNGTSARIGGLTLTMTPSIIVATQSSITWTCGGSIPSVYRPKAC